MRASSRSSWALFSSLRWWSSRILTFSLMMSSFSWFFRMIWLTLWPSRSISCSCLVILLRSLIIASRFEISCNDLNDSRSCIWCFLRKSLKMFDFNMSFSMFLMLSSMISLLKTNYCIYFSILLGSFRLAFFRDSMLCSRIVTFWQCYAFLISSLLISYIFW